ncbi:MAG: 2-hydroxyacyl-CoA dehydratase [Pirellulaceae bacterium]|mgnify:CR=1 FL=1|nr:2-hydroxyacyl-CoA dehydratase [Pirellulaceae bacterium]
MTAIAYCNPFVPPEWIAAHGLRPQWLRPRAARGESAVALRGVCPFAAAIVESLDVNGPEAPAAVVLTTTCDQMRYAAALQSERETPPVFLLNVPRMRRTESARLYLDELRRLGRFLESLGGAPLATDVLCETMVRYDRARRVLMRRRGAMSAREFQAAVAEVREDFIEPATQNVGLGATAGLSSSAERTVGQANRGTRRNTPLALVGGPLLRDDDERLDQIERAGGRIVLDATESGERTLPAALDASRLRTDPLAELARIYFDSIPDIFRRPNDDMFEWLATETARRGARGIVVRRHLWCDLWHAALPRLGERCALPLLEWEQDGEGSKAAFATRIEAFLEMLGEASEVQTVQ